jgi:hypothetical protein
MIKIQMSQIILKIRKKMMSNNLMSTLIVTFFKEIKYIMGLVGK